MPTVSSADNSRTVIPDTPPPGWEREVPRYRVTRETYPSPKARFRTEPPFAQIMDSSEWQYGERVHKAGEIIATTEWPNPGTMIPLTYSAKRVFEFFNSQMRSRMARSPFFGNEIRLETGLSGPLPKIIVAPQVQPIGVQPAGGWPRR
jgi:hypothetical protein